MIVLDTNIVSEPLKPKPDPEVLTWLDRQAPETLYLTTISLAELSAGVEASVGWAERREAHHLSVIYDRCIWLNIAVVVGLHTSAQPTSYLNTSESTLCK